MNARPLVFLVVRALIAVFFVPIAMLSLIFSRFFGKMLNIAIAKRGLNETQRTFNFKGIAGILKLARGNTR
nr:hypothetical protein [Candidatus Sigynarchaeum springense]MDO8117273.1 hypothetical protein [Candidatus Sigynarchaeota archaeon]